MQKWNQIAYVANNEEARKLLALLIENYNKELTYNIITSKGISKSIIEKLCEFEMIETSKSIAYGHTKEHVLLNSLYSITAYGEKFFNAITVLSTISKEEMNVQLQVGDFKRFKEKLNDFIQSNDEATIREAYEFIFGTSPLTDFYTLSKKKLNSIYSSINKIKKDFFSVVKEKDYENIVRTFETRIADFIEIIQEIEFTLRYDGKEIEKQLQVLENYINTTFYQERAKKIEGIQFTENSEDKLKEIVNAFINRLKSEGIYKTYTSIITNILKVATSANDQIELIREQLSEKSKLLNLAASFDKLSQEDAEELFRTLIANKKIQHISENEHAQFKEHTLYIIPPEIKKRTKQYHKIISEEELAYIKDKSRLEEQKRKLQKIKLFNTILTQDIRNNILPYHIYKVVRNSIIKDNEGQDELIATITPSTTNFIIRTKLADGRVQKLTIENSEVSLNVKFNIESKIREIEEECAILTSRITDKKFD